MNIEAQNGCGPLNEAEYPLPIRLQETISQDPRIIDPPPASSRYDHDMQRAQELTRALYRETYGRGKEPNLEWVQELLEIANRLYPLTKNPIPLGGHTALSLAELISSGQLK